MARRIVKIRARRTGQIYDYDASDLELRRGDRVLIETEKGLGIGVVLLEPQVVSEVEGERAKPLKKVLRKVNRDDLEREQRNLQREQEAFVFCRKKIAELGLPMRPIQVENFYDGSKMIFYFSAPERVDFRELVYQLAQRFHTRIEMQQIGVRDEAKLLGGIGICGRVICCQEFLPGFAPISVKMAKEQDLPLNPQKLSGPCGRLLCCLEYESAVYQDLNRQIPLVGEKVLTSQGKGEVVSRKVFLGRVTVRLENNEEVEMSVNEIQSREGKSAQGLSSSEEDQDSYPEKDCPGARGE